MPTVLTIKTIMFYLIVLVGARERYENFKERCEKFKHLQWKQDPRKNISVKEKLKLTVNDTFNKKKQ